MKFIQGGLVRSLENVDPRTTVLNWLRYEERHVGTKEGCAEGDCGACTVVLGEMTSSGKIYKAVNACILFLPCLNGKELVTVEDLKNISGELHPIQQKMVELHGSQCGFCTPGFVMSMYAEYMSVQSEEQTNTNDLLAGNLCRCTGYGPIIDAANAMGRADSAELESKEHDDLLKSIAPKEMLSLVYQPKNGHERRFFAPNNLDELGDIYLQNPDAQILAGGTDIGLWVTKQDRDLNTVIYLGDVEELKQVKNDNGELIIGAGVTYSEALNALKAYHPSLGELIRRIGSVQIRNSGTLGGNIANGSPIGDTMPALIALGATLTLRKGSKRRTIPLESYFIDYGKQSRQKAEFVESFSIPALNPNQTLHIYKISKRFDQDISAICFCMSVTLSSDEKISDVKLAFGGMAGIPKRAFETEKALIGQDWTEESLRIASRRLADDFKPLSDMRASADYRLTVSKNLLLKAWAERSGLSKSHVLAIREPANV